MNYFVILVESGREFRVKDHIQEFLESNEHVLLPTRELYIKKGGKTSIKTQPLFSGYLFLQKETISGEFLNNLKKIRGFFKFLNSNKDIKPLTKDDVSTLGSFLHRDYNAHVSKVIFNSDDRIVVKEGPLKEFEGRIIKVDRRKRRAKVQLTMYNNSHTIDFSFLDLEAI